MKLLIVEDSPQKAEQIKSFVATCATEIHIDVVDCAHRAFEMIQDEKPGLVILDVRIPYSKGGESLEEASVWLVNEIHRKIAKEDIPLVIGATQYPEAKRNVEDIFGQFLWNVVVVDSDQVEWKKWLGYAVHYQCGAARSAKLLNPISVDAVVLTALRSPEFHALVDVFGGGQKLTIEDTYESWMLCQLQDSSGTSRSIVLACADDMGMSAMSSLTTRVCMTLSPRVLFLAGIMGGNREHVGLTDLVVVEETWDCRAGKLTEEGLVADVRPCRGSVPLKNLARSILDEKFFLNVLEKWPGDKTHIPKFRSGAVACSPAVIAFDEAFAELGRQKRKVFGVEMEGFGCYYAAEQLGVKAPKFIAMKSVCDLGDKQKSDALQKFAAHVSATSIKAVLAEPLLWK